MREPRCECGWMLFFIRKPGRWVALCRNPSCKIVEVTP